MVEPIARAGGGLVEGYFPWPGMSAHHALGALLDPPPPTATGYEAFSTAAIRPP